MKCMSFIDDSRCKISSNCINTALSIQFHHTINIPISFPLKFVCHGCWQISQKKSCCARKKLFHLTLILPFVESSFGVDWCGHPTVLFWFKSETWASVRMTVWGFQFSLPKWSSVRKLERSNTRKTASQKSKERGIRKEITNAIRAFQYPLLRILIFDGSSTVL